MKADLTVQVEEGDTNGVRWLVPHPGFVALEIQDRASGTTLKVEFADPGLEVLDHFRHIGRIAEAVVEEWAEVNGHG